MFLKSNSEILNFNSDCSFKEGDIYFGFDLDFDNEKIDISLNLR